MKNSRHRLAGPYLIPGKPNGKIFPVSKEAFQGIVYFRIIFAASRASGVKSLMIYAPLASLAA
jgi:hypothetical protein